MEEAAALRRQLKIKKNQLRLLFSKPVFPKGFSGKYLDENLKVDPGQNTAKAIEVVKEVIKHNAGKSKENDVNNSKENNTVSHKRKRDRKSVV